MSRCRTYRITTYQNKQKNSIIFELLKEYRKYCSFMMKKQYIEYLKTGRLNKFIDIKNDISLLSIRYKRIAVYQMIGQLQGWIVNKDNKIKEIIENCTRIQPEQKRRLHLIRIFRIKTEQDLEIRKEKISITKEDITLFKSINRSVRWKLPSSKRISMQLNKNVCKLIKKEIKHKRHKANNFEYWIELSTLTKGKKLYIPANSNNYLIKQIQKGKLLNSIRIDFKKDNIIFNLMINKESFEEKIEPCTDSIGIDFGTKHLFAISTGQILGVNFGKKLFEFDKQIHILQKNLQKQKIKLYKSKRYNRLIFRCKNFIENEINRNLNKIVKQLKPKELILEKLDFSHSKLSKSMNRILRKCGRSVIRSKLIMIQEDYGIKITEVNPEYSSQTCNRCGFVHRQNRKTRNIFKCKICNYKKHADISASREIRSRSSYPIFGSKSGKKIIKKHLFEQFKNNILQCGEIINKNTNFISPDRRAIFLENDHKTFNEFYVLLKSRNKLTKCAK